MSQSRFRNGGLWVSLVVMILLLLAHLGLGQYIPAGVDAVATGAVTLLAFLGVVSNPKDGSWYWSKNTPWSTRLRDYKMWVGIAAVLAALVLQILKWFSVAYLPFDVNATILVFLNILQAVGVINGQPIENPYMPSDYKEQLKADTSVRGG